MGVHPNQLSELPSSYVLFAPATPLAPKVCRDLLRSLLTALGLDELIDSAVLCVSELVTNVHRHAKGDVKLTVTVERTRVWVAVHDEDPAPPCARRALRDDTDGRGLLLVAAVSDDCGVSGGPPGALGKSVWFQLAIPAGSTT